VVLLDLFTRLPVLNHRDRILQKYRNASSSPMVKRKIVRVATAHHADHWLHLRKGDLPDDPWLKRALIAGASTFSKDERKFWLHRIEKRTELEKLLAKWTESGS
jgi:hypothetical protein